jgi:hypothetical protein
LSWKSLGNRKRYAPTRTTEEEVKADLRELQGQLGGSDWINLDWITANPTNVIAAVVDSTSVGFG